MRTEKGHLYQRIADGIRMDILEGRISTGDRLPSIRDTAAEWKCTPSTVMKAYHVLAEQGLVVSRAGQGTRVIGENINQDIPLRRAELIHRAEAFLLEVLTEGYEPQEVEQAVRIALDRWRVLKKDCDADDHEGNDACELQFVGSHDPVIPLLAERMREQEEDTMLKVSFAGSLGGLIALVDGEADLAGSHLYDTETGDYNVAFIRRFFPGKKVALVTAAHRRLGLILPCSNPGNLGGLEDLTRKDVRFINRQEGSGTRVWLDVELRRLGIPVSSINGYLQQASTHSEVAMAVAEGRADVGVGIESAAISCGLEFMNLTMERYDLVLPEHTWDRLPVRRLVEWISSDEYREAVLEIGGYEVSESGRVRWV